MTLDEMDLTPEMRAIAQDVKDRFGDAVVFTSGRRTRAMQAHAMAANTVKLGRGWIRKTYFESPVRSALCRWLDGHPHATARSEIEEGFAVTLDGVSDADFGRFTLHAGGNAFDLLPQHGPAGDDLKLHLKSRRDITFLDHEGGAERWHAQRRWLDVEDAG